MNETASINTEEAKRRALEELQGYRERRRLEREAKAKADETAEVEIERTILARREGEARQVEVRAAHARFMEEHCAKVEAMRAAERAGRASGDFRLSPVAPPPARRVARLLRQRLGDDFDSILADIKACDFRSFQREVERIPVDEECERKHREQQAREAAMAEAARTLPTPESPEEEEILRRHGFMPDSRVLEIGRTAP
ncbi:hypothetical protein ACUXK4_003965 [Methylorubrum extorquens]